MGGEQQGSSGWPPAPGGAPPYLQKDDHWTHFDSNSVNAVSFGFVATAILIAMFLVMAIFEKFLRTTTPAHSAAGGRRRTDIVAPDRIGGGNVKLGHPSSKIPVKAREVSVVMPGHNVPTFLAHPAPVPCHPERVSWPSHQQQSDNVQ